LRVLGKFNLGVVRDSETQTKRRERGIVVASPLQSTINDQVEAMREAGISAIALDHEVMRTFCFLIIDSYHRRARFLESWL